MLFQSVKGNVGRFNKSRFCRMSKPSYLAIKQRIRLTWRRVNISNALITPCLPRSNVSEGVNRGYTSRRPCLILRRDARTSSVPVHYDNVPGPFIVHC